MKIYNVINARSTFEKVKDKSIPVKLAWKIVRFLNMTKEVSDFYKEKMSEILDEFGARDKDGRFIPIGDGIQIIEGKEEACGKAIVELRELDVEKPEQSFSLDELECLSISVKDMEAIFDFITE